MSKFLVYDYAGGCGDKFTSAGFKHNEEYEGDPFDAARKLFDIGLNVMVARRQSETSPIIVYSDILKFQQR